MAGEIADRLRRRGILLTDGESGEQLVVLLEAVERFEAAVQRKGGDLMVDEPVREGGPVDPDNRAFALPAREERDSVDDYIERLNEATARITSGAE
ncbi:MAG: hypothetical protein ABJB78_09405 [Betaproteobacteria bacterium]